MTDIGNGLAAAEKLYTQYGSRAREVKASGKKVIGYLSALGPVEIMTAAGVLPIRLKGNVSEAISKGDAYMETIVCPFVRNVFDLAVKGKYDFLDGMVLPHQCDSIDRTNETWSYTLNLPYWHFLNLPHVADDPSIAFTKEILRIFVKSLEKYTGTTITDEAIAKAVAAHNQNRKLMRDLYDLRKSNPPLISGVEMMKVCVAAMSLPVEESSALVESVIKEVKGRTPAAGDPKAKRIMIIGDQIDDVAVIEAIESTGAYLVMDDLSTGSKMYWQDVDATADPFRELQSVT